VSARFEAMPASLRGALMPFQRDGVQYGLARRGRVLIADEMGVGKTVQALALAACYQVGTCVLVWRESERVRA
jgi:SWI/SNF-related matrix-associated actin-dependent regulator 1 of chromatin subfamily A